MQPEERIVTRLPLTELWSPEGPLATERLRRVGRQEIKALLRTGPVHFVVADVGLPLRWIALTDAYKFWKQELKPHLIEAASERVYLEALPDQYGY